MVPGAFQTLWQFPTGSIMVTPKESKNLIMKCPICGKPTTWQDNPDRPFCSERCRVIDLARWASEEYSVSIPLPDISEDTEQLEQD